jgi:hypothetical protein
MKQYTFTTYVTTVEGKQVRRNFTFTANSWTVARAMLSEEIRTLQPA